MLLGFASCEKEQVGYDVWIKNDSDFYFSEVQFRLNENYYIYSGSKFKQGIKVEQPVIEGTIIKLVLIYADNKVYAEELYPIIGDVKISITDVYIPVGGLGIVYDWQ